MVSLLEQQEQNAGAVADGNAFTRPTYSWDRVRKLDELIAKTKQVHTAYIQEGKRIGEELQEERKRTLAQYFELGHLLRKQLEESNLLPRPNDQMIADRRSFGWHVKHMYKRTNLERYPFVDEFVTKDWEKREQGARQAENATPTVSTSLASAINGYEVSHWNRMIARDDFEHRRELMDQRQRGAGLSNFAHIASKR